MADKRMFTKKIIDSDAFLDMPLSTQALYFHLNMQADDDGFVNNPKRIQRLIGASPDDLKLLAAKRFLICFESGVVVVKHFRMHNTLKSDRYTPTMYQEELQSLEIVGKRGSQKYTEKSCFQIGSNVVPNCFQIGSVEEVRIEENRLEEERGRKEEVTGKNVYGKYDNVFMTADEYHTIYETYEKPLALIDKISCYLANANRDYRNHFALIDKIATEDKWPKKSKPKPKEIKEPVEVCEMPDEIREKLKGWKFGGESV